MNLSPRSLHILGSLMASLNSIAQTRDNYLCWSSTRKLSLEELRTKAITDVAKRQVDYMDDTQFGAKYR